MNNLSTSLLYSQGTVRTNLPRLLSSLTQAQISHVLLGQRQTVLQPQEQPTWVVAVRLSIEGFEKFHQVFVGNRFVPLNCECQRVFWDSRTGLTLHIFLPDEIKADREHPPRVQKSAQSNPGAAWRGLFEILCLPAERPVCFVPVRLDADR
jgi:hypothetical protein